MESPEFLKSVKEVILNAVEFEYEAFVYKYTNIIDGKWYIGYHKGKPLDGYVHSSCSKEFLELTAGSEPVFIYEVLKYGTMIAMKNLEHKLLKQAKANRNKQSYNLSNGSPHNFEMRFDLIDLFIEMVKKAGKEGGFTVEDRNIKETLNTVTSLQIREEGTDTKRVNRIAEAIDEKGGNTDNCDKPVLLRGRLIGGTHTALGAGKSQAVNLKFVNPTDDELEQFDDLTEDEIRHIGGVLNIEDEVKRVTNTQGDHVKALYDYKCNNPKFELVVGGEYVNQILKHRGVTVAAERKRIINKAINRYKDNSVKAQNKKWIRWWAGNDLKRMEARVNRQPEGTIAFSNSSKISRKIEHDMIQAIVNPDNEDVYNFKAYVYFRDEAAKKKWENPNSTEGCAELTETFNRLFRMLPEVQIKGANKGDTVPRRWSFVYMETEKDDEEMLSESID